MLAAGSVLRWVCVSLWNETFILLKANLVWFLITLPLALPLAFPLSVVLGTLLPPPSAEEQIDLALPLMLTGFLVLLIPNPASLGLHAIAAVMTRRDSPNWSQFTAGLRGRVGLGLKLFLIGLVVTVVLTVNLLFYFAAQPDLLKLAAVLFAYLLLFWLAMQLYLGPIAVLLGETRLLALYRRAAMLVLAQPIFTLLLLVALLVLVLICLIAVPIYPLFAMAFAALTGTRALDQLRRRYDPQPDLDEESV
jgi:uncharacterized membrane protein YesL